MTPEQRARVRDVFEQALDAAPSDADAWLASAVPDDNAVRAEVASLLAYERRARSFLAEPPSATAAAHEDVLTPGETVGPYTVMREIGRGGMGRVYLAEDRRLGRPVALKAVAPHLAGDGTHRERLRREARATAALTHPAICAVYALDEIDGNVFLVTEFVDGRTLREEIATGVQPPVERTMKTAVELASGLAAAHAHGIAHRDLKPANVMRTTDGRLKILDFGLARVDDLAAGAGAGHTISVPGTTLGTPLYMAPEQLNGGAVDQRADVFAFGVLMYEYATGVHPFQGQTSMATVARILEADPIPIESRRPDLPPALAAVIGRCLAKQPAGRFETAAEIVKELARPAAVPREVGTRWWRVHQVAIVLLYLVACTIAWNLKEWHPAPAATWAFIALGVLAAVGGVLRGHLLFTECVSPDRIAEERRRTARPRTIADTVLALLLFGQGLAVAPFRPVASVLTMALAVGVAAAAILIEPSTTAAAFPDSPPQQSR